MNDIERWLHKWLVVEPAAFLDRITRRRVLHVIALLVLLYFAQQVVAFDLTFLFGVDLGLLIEVSTGLLFLVLRDNGRMVVNTTRHFVAIVKACLSNVYRRGATRAARSRLMRVLKPPKSSDEDGAAGNWVFV